jgi:hypothetical protein
MWSSLAGKRLALVGSSIGLALVSHGFAAGEAAKPAWCATKWPGDDKPYAAARKEADAYDAWTGYRWNAPITKKAVAAIGAFKQKPDDPVLLYRASFLYMYARRTDPAFEPDPMTSSLCGALLRGWQNTKAKPSYEFSRLGYIFAGNYMGVSDLDDLGLALLDRKPNDLDVMAAYITAAYSRVGSSNACRERCVQFAEKLVAAHPDRPGVWLSRARAYWVRSCGDSKTMKADLIQCERSGRKFLSLAPANHPARARLEKWLETVQDTLKGL